MGIDVWAYKRLKWAAEGTEGATELYPNRNFPGREGTIREGWYTFDEVEDGPSMGYGRYNLWRAKLAKLAGYNEHEAWAGLKDSEPFGMLVNFSDCEGILGTEVCKKLARDFEAFDERAKELDAAFYDVYVDFHNCFKFASDNGAVRFG